MENKEEILKIYEEISKYLEMQKQLKEDIKLVNDEIRTEYADIKGFKNKKGETDKNAVKNPELMSAIDKVFNDSNSFDIKIANYEQYLTDIKNGEEFFPVEKTKRFLSLKENLKDILSELKEAEKNLILENKIDKETFKALKKIAEIKIFNKEEKKENPIVLEKIQELLKFIEGNEK